MLAYCAFGLLGGVYTSVTDAPGVTHTHLTGCDRGRDCIHMITSPLGNYARADHQPISSSAGNSQRYKELSQACR